ncbi:hypothetical protein OH687_11245 [Burkholderia anthina]|nr:hypothetical protein OH687_11245 [Burkholderia anthina]
MPTNRADRHRIASRAHDAFHDFHPRAAANIYQAISSDMTNRF